MTYNDEEAAHYYADPLNRKIEGKKSHSLDAGIVWGAGYIVGHLIRQGIQAMPVMDEGGYTDEIEIFIPNPDHHYPDLRAVVKVLGWVDE